MRFLTPLALAGTAYAATATTEIFCSTAYASTSVASPKSTGWGLTTASELILHLTETPTVTLTPAPVTSTVTTTSTEVDVVDTQTTDVYTTSHTATVTETATEIDSFTQTVTTSTTVTISSTTTIATPAGFTAIASELGYHAKRELADRAATSTANAPAVGTVTASSTHYPSAIVCETLVTDYVTLSLTTTLSSSVTTTVAPITAWTTVSETATVTSTSTLADATTIVTVPVTVSTTVTSTSSTTTTTTSTVTVDAPSATFYAQCDTDNRIDSYLGQEIGYISFNSAFTMLSAVTTDTTGYSCCVICANTDDCTGWAQSPAGYCYYLKSDGRCDGTNSFGDVFHYYTTGGPTYTIGNGACGFLDAKAGY
ncbi:hypothetical protein ASPZODRAFT_18021 [Penicilliopsis zonata CBS 506.65]|uniref:Apple domain-containing protein n=1 Tax=Penicilliopsis zonata CBS 506.65 TaxID=1073090 RepID=A0A1L9SD12_9EURO|nr:hypothetical protein ASPZODRAFT_18021 [Penicilliopsis zonata CBS 506.65]OJJ45110.1 hypothetical protein ASPZODRAFT_18021 [Penicilliopsis zonata CBS 506.65]